MQAKYSKLIQNQSHVLRQSILMLFIFDYSNMLLIIFYTFKYLFNDDVLFEFLWLIWLDSKALMGLRNYKSLLLYKFNIYPSSFYPIYFYIAFRLYQQPHHTFHVLFFSKWPQLHPLFFIFSLIFQHVLSSRY